MLSLNLGKSLSLRSHLRASVSVVVTVPLNILQFDTDDMLFDGQDLVFDAA